MNLDQLERAGLLPRAKPALICSMGGFHQRRFAHAARAPQQRVIGGQALGEALGIFDQHVAHAVDALEQRHLDAVDVRDRRQASVRMPDKGVGGGQIGRGRVGRRETLQRIGDPRQYVAVAARRATAWLGAGLAFDAGLDRDLAIFGEPWQVSSEIRAALSGRPCARKRATGPTIGPERRKTAMIEGLAALQLGGGRYSPREITG